MRSSLNFLSISQRRRRAVGSMPDVGSSRMMTFEFLPMRAFPTETLRFWPPERFLERTFLWETRSTSCKVVLIDASISSVSPLNNKNISKCSSGVNVSNKILCYGQIPSTFQNSFISSKILIPNADAFPDVFGNNPVSSEIAVVLPAPLWPSSAKI